MPASIIKKIEVITTPPAKYDSEGLAGIINIITVQKAVDGYSAAIGLRYNYPQGPSANVSSTIKTGKLGFSITGIHGIQQPIKVTAGNSRQTLGAAQSDLLQIGTNITNGHNINWGTELSFEADSLNLFTASLNYNLNNTDQSLLRTSAFSQGDLLQGYRSLNTNNVQIQSTDAGINFQHGFKNHKNRLLTLSYLYSFFGNRQQNLINYSQRNNFDQADYSQFNNAGAHEQTAQLDYIQPSKTFTFEAGLKAIFRNNFSDFETLNFTGVSGVQVADPSLTNSFHYHQNVYSAYNSYQFKMSWAILKAGVRLERTHVDAIFSETSIPLNTSYINVVPSINLQHPINANSSLIFGFTDRTARPSISQLNPFIDKSNIGFISFGNPDLRPVIRHLFELIYNYSGKATFTTRLAYSFSNNTIESVTSLISDMISQTTFFNVGKLKNASIYSSFNYPVFSKLNLDANGQLAYIKLVGASNGMPLGNSGIRTTFNGSMAYKIKPGFRFGFNVNYNSPYILLQGRGTNYFGSSISITRSWLADRLTLTGILNNPYQKFRRYTSSTESEQFYQTNFVDNYYRTFAVALNYRIGKQARSVKKNTRGIYNDDVKNN